LRLAVSPENHATVSADVAMRKALKGIPEATVLFNTAKAFFTADAAAADLSEMTLDI
jgi:hypothetical protein